MTNTADPATTPLSPPRVITLAPAAGAPSELVVLLHGVGASAESFAEIARALGPSRPHAEWLTPDGLHPFDQGGAGRQWFSVRGVTETNRAARVREAGGEVSRWIDAELDKRGLAHDKLVLVGFSQGSIVSSWLAVHRSPRPSAVVMFSGRVADDGTPVVGAPVPVFMAHGANDPVIPSTELAPGARSLEAWGATVTQRLYPNLAHTIDARELADARSFLEANGR